MKTINLYAALLFSIFGISESFAQHSVKQETIKVWGNCDMCKKVIEKAARSAGATKAEWNAESKLLKVSYDESKTSGGKIQETIANSGYDTRDLTANNNAYKKLPDCCHYNRKIALADEIVTPTSYTCPMHPKVVSNNMGKCPECGMYLVENKTKVYTCPMHPDVISNKKGKCPDCGMSLVEKRTATKQ